MKVVYLNQIKDTDKDVKFSGGNSQRFVLKSDGLGFAMMKTNIPKGKPNKWHYKYHLEACYCVKGKGILTNLTTGEYYDIFPDTVYMIDNHEEHTFQALTNVVLISVFNPPLSGSETHDEDGVYKLI